MPFTLGTGFALFDGGWEEGACAPLTLGARLATALDSAVIVLLILESLALS